MGVVLNPVAYRVGYKYSWKDVWYSHRLIYSVFLHDVLSFKLLMHYIFFRFFSFRKQTWLYSHVNIYIYNNQIFVKLFLYDGNEVQLYYDLARSFKKIYWKKMNVFSYWLKRQLFDKRIRLQRFHFFTRVIRFFYDFLIKDDMRLILKDDRRTSFKLTELRNNKKNMKNYLKDVTDFEKKKKKKLYHFLKLGEKKKKQIFGWLEKK